MTLNFLRSPLVTLAILIYIVAQSGPQIAHAVDEIITGHIVFNGPGQNSARDIHTTGNIGGMRFYNGNSLTAIPDGAAIQFYGNGHTVFSGQAFIDSGAHDNAAVIIRTAGTGQGVGERMRVTATGNVGIGTAAPNEQLELTGNLRLPATSSMAGIIRSGANTLLHTYGVKNFFAGVGAGNLAMNGDSNTGTGNQALQSNTTGIANTATGSEALRFNTSGGNNTAMGESALRLNTSGGSNTAIGYTALGANTGGGSNTATGAAALVSNTSGGANTAIGGAALLATTVGSNNVAIGSIAGGANTTGSNNTFVGALANASADNLTNATAIGSNATVGASNSLVLGGTGGNAVNVGIGTTTPISALQVVGNAIQIPVASGASAPVTGCSTSADVGRMLVASPGNGAALWVCKDNAPIIAWVGVN